MTLRADRLAAENAQLQQRLSAALSAAAAGGAPVPDARLDKKALERVFSNDKAPKFQGGVGGERLWAEWETRFIDKWEGVVEDGAEILKVVEKFAVGVGPERARFSGGEVSRRGWEKICKALYKAPSACCPIGSTSSAYVQWSSDGRNGCAAWQKLKYTYRTRRAGNDLARTVVQVSEAKIPEAITAYEARVTQWEKAYSRVLEDEDKATRPCR